MTVDMQLDYMGFRQQYEQQHPASVPILRLPPEPELQYETGVYPSWVKWAVLLMFIASAIISGVHTVPTVNETIEQTKVALWVQHFAALSSFVAVELAILLSAYLLIKNKILGWLILIVTFVIAIIANVQSSMSALSASDNSDWTRMVAIVLGAGAPLIVLMSGKLLVSIFNGERAITARAQERLSTARETYNTSAREAEEKYQEACRIFDAAVLEAWERYQKGHKRASAALSAPSVVSALSAPAMPVADARGHGHGQGYSRTTDARERVQQYLLENPEAIKMGSRELAKMVGVGKTIAADELKRVRQSLPNGQPAVSNVLRAAEQVIEAVADNE